MKTKKHIKLFSIMMILVLITSTFLVSAAGDNYTYYMDKKLQGSSGLANRTYYIDKTAIDAGYEDEAINAIKSWVTATKNNKASVSKVGFKRVYSKTNATIVIYGKAKSTFPSSVKGALGYVVYYSGSNSISLPGGMPSKNWSQCAVYVDNKLSSSKAQRTICHEIGHGLGLLHPMHPASTGSSIMLPDDTVYPKYKSDKPTSADAFMLDTRYRVLK